MGFNLLINSPQKIIMGLLGKACGGLEAGCFLALGSAFCKHHFLQAEGLCLAGLGCPRPPNHRLFTRAKRGPGPLRTEPAGGLEMSGIRNSEIPTPVDRVQRFMEVSLGREVI